MFFETKYVFSRRGKESFTVGVFRVIITFKATHTCNSLSITCSLSSAPDPKLKQEQTYCYFLPYMQPQQDLIIRFLKLEAGGSTMFNKNL